jgi:succinyl-CoA synthetase beta subunit
MKGGMMRGMRMSVLKNSFPGRFVLTSMYARGMPTREVIMTEAKEILKDMTKLFLNQAFSKKALNLFNVNPLSHTLSKNTVMRGKRTKKRRRAIAAIMSV